MTTRKRQTRLKRKALESGLTFRDIAAKRGVAPSVVTRQAAVGVKTLRIAREYAAILHCEAVELLD